MNAETWDELYGQYMKRQINKKEFAEQLKVSRPTLDKLLRHNTQTLMT